MFSCEFVLGQLGHAQPAQRIVSSLNDAAAEAANCFTLSEIEEATRNFEKKIGSGGFGVVYYGKMHDGKEIAVKVLINNSYQGKREFANEVVFHVYKLFLFHFVFILALFHGQSFLFANFTSGFSLFLCTTMD